VRRAGYWVLGIFFLLVFASTFFFLWYKVSLLHVVVKNAVLQKAAAGERARIDDAFERARAAADRQGRSEEYLQTLFAISQRVEKVQTISPDGTEEIVRKLEEFAAGAGKH
jgi:phage-related baseplate assembly protein